MSDTTAVEGPVEEAPNVALLPSPDALAGAKCRYCEDAFPLSKGGVLARAQHEKKEHREEWEANRKPRRPTRDGARARAASPKKARSIRKPSATPSGPGNRPRTPAAKEPARQSAAELLSLVVRGVATVMVRAAPQMAPWLEPAGMMVGFEAPIAGPVGDEALAGSALDKVAVQPLLRAQDRYERVVPLVLAPACVGAIAWRPELRPELYPLWRLCAAPMLPAMVEELRRQAAEAEKLAESAAQLAEMDPEFAKLFEGGADPLEAMFNRLFPVAEPPMAPANGSGV